MPAPNHTFLLPSLLTLGNLLCGFTALALMADPELTDATLTAAALILIAAVLDGFDGLAARRLGVETDFGARLDALADVVSFGAAPALIVAKAAEPTGRLAWAAAAWLLTAAALRLARQEAEAERGAGFLGLPCPAAGGMVAAIAVALATAQQELSPDAYERLAAAAGPALAGVAIGLGLLMVSRVAYPHPLKLLTGRPRGFGAVAATLLTAAALTAGGGYAPLAICVLFVVCPLWPSTAPRRALLTLSRRDA